jgi:hypothetical protein
MRLDPTAVPCHEEPLTGWFGHEFGRALASGAEVGIDSGYLVHGDLDRILMALSEATLQLAGFKSSEKGDTADHPGLQALPEEAGFLLDQIAEIGIYAYQVDDKAYKDWFVRPAIVLANLENKLEGVRARTTGRPYLAGRSLAAWCLANYAFQPSVDGACRPGDPPVHGWRQLGVQAQSDPQLWSEAKGLAMSPAKNPAWMPPVRDEPDGQQDLSMFLDAVQTRVEEGRGVRT